MARKTAKTIESEEEMVQTAVSISPMPPENKGLDYVYLRTEGIRLVQQLSGAIWTDYNEHDPGVTTLEQLCYALTDLSYRAEMPMQDLLSDPKTGELQPRRHGLFTARRILPCNPVSVNDYRKLIVDRVSEVANVWLTPHIPTDDPRDVNGLYDVIVYAPTVHVHPRRHHELPHPKRRHKHHSEQPHEPDYEEPQRHAEHRHDPDSGASFEQQKRLLYRVRRVYNRYRNLCEDLHSIRLLSPLPAVIHAAVDVRGKEPVERILAEILFALGNLCAPELQRRPLNALIDAGETSDQIFNGPLLQNGFIDDDQLQPKVTTLPVNTMIRALAQVAGVVGVRSFEVRVGESVYGPDSGVPIPPERYLYLDTEPRANGKGFPIRLVRNGSVCSPDPDLVRLELDLLWAGYRRTYPLAAQYEEYFGVPKGQGHDLEAYYSIQNQYPPIYGIGEDGLPPDVTPARRAQAKQLKGYLLPFEQLMANYFAQLAHVGDLFSIEPDSWQTYYTQSLVKSVPDVEPVLAPDYLEKLNAIAASMDTTLERRTHFLGFLLSLYANELNPLSDPTQCSPQRATTVRLLQARQEFLRFLTRSTRSRGRAVDTLGEFAPANIAGMEYKCRIQMGLDLERHRPTRERFAQSGLSLARDNGDLPVARFEERHARHIEESFRPVSVYSEPDDLVPSSALLQGMSLPQEFIAAAQEPDNLFVGRLPGESAVMTAYKNADGEWIPIAIHSELEMAIREAYALSWLLKEIYKSLTQLYIVEHLLLRFEEEKRNADANFAFSFTLTAVVGLPSKEHKNRANRKMVEEIIRENTPAHLVAEVLFLHPWELFEFEELYQMWRHALRTTNAAAIVRTSARLRRFLKRHRRRSSTAAQPAKNRDGFL